MHPPEPPAAPLDRSNRASHRLALSQGVFYLVTGLWPIVHMRSFEAVTGPKVDRWLVRTTGGLLGVIGGALGSAAHAGRVSPEIRALGAGTAAVLAAVDCTYVARKRIPPIYLLDAVAEAALVAGWMLAELRTSRPAAHAPSIHSAASASSSGAIQ